MYVDPIKAARPTEESPEVMRAVVGIANGFWLGALAWLIIGLAIVCALYA